ncbi:hypothetical protein Sjap_024935 [Stephania japonica]|uniref:Uncharacterized protein n=1 Tax=Stephania japonica TaxID=461633 RepID=A0AAP0EJN7_9MAGN
MRGLYVGYGDSVEKCACGYVALMEISRMPAIVRAFTSPKWIADLFDVSSTIECFRAVGESVIWVVTARDIYNDDDDDDYGEEAVE